MTSNKNPKRQAIMADGLILLISLVASALAIFIFDIHWSFYPGNTVFPPNKRVFDDFTPYLFGIPVGGIVLFIIIKAMMYVFLKEEEAQHDGKKSGELVLKIKKGKTYVD